MNDEKSKGKILTLSGLKIVVIFYFIMFSTSAIIVLIPLFYDFSTIYYATLLVGILLTLFSLLGIFIGINKIHEGNVVFDNKHINSTYKARKFVIFGIIILFTVVFFILPFLTSFPPAYAFCRTLAMVPFWLALVFLIKEITSKSIVNLLWMAFSARFVMYFISGLISRSDLYITSVEFFVLINLIAILPSFVFIYCFYVTYNRIKNNDL